MYDCVHLEDSYIKFTKSDSDYLWYFIEGLNSIENFNKFFDEFDTICKIEEENESYELTYHNDGNLNSDEILYLIENIIRLCTGYKHTLNLTLKIFDDGQFIKYLIIIDNEIYDVTNKINNLIRFEENNLKIPS